MRPTLDPDFVLAVAQHCWEGLIRPALRQHLDERERTIGRRGEPGEFFIVFGIAAVVGPSLGVPIPADKIASGEACVMIVERKLGPLALFGAELGAQVADLLSYYPPSWLPVLYVHHDGDVGLAAITRVVDTGAEGAAINAPMQGGLPS